MSYVETLKAANSNVICSAAKEDVGVVSVECVLRKRLRIPLFQRRYCWGEGQWSTLLSDVLKVVRGEARQHSLGRATVAASRDEARVLVLDGQQRNTTTSLLLAAIRDLTRDESLRDELERLLGGRRGLPPVLIPGYCDRDSYAKALLDGDDGESNDSDEASKECASLRRGRPYAAKTYFLRKLRPFENAYLSAIAEATLRKLTWLYFPIDLTGNDGTENLFVVYERLAVRDAMFCVPQRGNKEQVNMGAADFVRNLVLGSFQTEATAVRNYETIWHPRIEARAHGDIAKELEAYFEAFLLDEDRTKNDTTKVKKSPEKNHTTEPLYPRFRAWWQCALLEEQRKGRKESTDDHERIATLLLERLALFADNYFTT